LSIQVLTTRANGPPERQRNEDGIPCVREIRTSTTLRKTDDRVLSAPIEQMRAALGLIDTDEADVLGICRLLVAVENLPTSSRRDVT
jgi:hypothetical protein